MPEKEILLKRISEKYKYGSVYRRLHLQSLSSVLFIVNMAVSAFSQSNVWPFIFQTPENPPAANDSSLLKFSNDFDFYEVFTNRSVIVSKKVEQKYVLDQLFDYTITDHDYNTRNHIMDLSGKILWTSFPFPVDSFGLDWTPIISYSSRFSGSAFYSMADVGPVLKTSFYGLPVNVRMGLSGYGWNDKLNKGITGTPIADYQSDPGYYGGLSIGDMSRKIGNIPLYINVKSIGKVIQGNGLGVVMGSALLKQGLGSSDSLFLFVGDSLYNGKEIYLRNSMGNGVYADSPWRIRHSLAVSGGFKAAERFGLLPAFIYSFNLNSVDYPSDTNSLDNVKNTYNTVTAQIQTAQWMFIHYNGGLELSWLNQDRLFKKHPTGTLDDEEIKARLFDYHGDLASTDHDLTIDLPRNIALEYRLKASKDSKQYDLLLNTSKEDMANLDESDYIRIDHHAGVVFDSLSGLSLQPYLEYSKSYLYYIRAANSGNSKSRSEYRLGLDASFVRGKFWVDEKLFAEAEKTDYKFKDAQLDPPPYSRRFSSTLTLNWDLGKFSLNGSWVQIYHDDGAWYDKEYLDFNAVTGDGYYAIERKSNDYTIQFYLTIPFENLNVIAGSSLSDIFQRTYSYESDEFITEDLGRGYIIEPSLKFQYFTGAFNAQGRIGRIINTLDSGKYNLRRNWDIALSLRLEFK